MYKYPDRNDVMTVDFIDSVSDGNYWDRSERNVLGKCIEMLQEKGAGTFLDLGCGQGRLMPFFAPYVSEIIAAEPDRSRYRYALELADVLMEEFPEKKVKVVNGDIHTVCEGDATPEFDAVLCSHVIQHIKYDICRDMLASAVSCLKKGGLLFLTTTLSPVDTDTYSVEDLNIDGSKLSQPTDRAGFEAAYGREDKLPVAYYTTDTVCNLLESLGCACTAKYGYHFIFPDRTAGLEDDMSFQQKGSLERAKDILYIFEKE